MATRTVSVQQMVDVVMTLPPDRLASVYDFARFVQSQSSAAAPLADIFGETEEEIRADEELDADAAYKLWQTSPYHPSL